ncbi:MAG: HipA domain-containing protein [Acidobacteria bacterium]|nr:HipA domain-containing protein [Acidobacteriota bacterium]
MRRNARTPGLRTKPSEKKAIKYWADYQCEWNLLIPSLPVRRYLISTVDSLSVPGDAPKDFISDCEYRPGHRSRRQRLEAYIAKVGSKFYPNESITEQLITRIGQIYGLKIADSKLRIVNGQVRFMSKYFLNSRSEQLTHGAEIYEVSLGKENYSEIRDKKIESEYFTFQMTEEAIKEAFPIYVMKIMRGFVEMLTFDALIGHNDWHPYNWGVIVPVRKTGAPRFSPVFDTARALFWNVQERRIQQMLNDQNQFDAYVRKCEPPIGWDGEQNVDFFRLVGLIWRDFERYQPNIERFLLDSPLESCERMLDREFRLLMTAERRELIKRCIRLRRQQLCQTLAAFRDNKS